MRPVRVGEGGPGWGAMCAYCGRLSPSPRGVFVHCVCMRWGRKRQSAGQGSEPFSPAGCQCSLG